jgi:dTDP-glucose 4,6-dehydratase
MTILVTGGFGFIGSNFVLRHLEKFPDENVVVLDKMTYAANPQNLAQADMSRLAVFRGDINNEELVANILSAHNPRAIINFAAESHVDRSISGPLPFVQTNINGLANLLELARQYNSYRASIQQSFRFIQVSTDEVYGSLSATALPSKEGDAYAPRSPYAASKAAGDHLCMAYHTTFGLPVIVTNSGNNYGPRQHSEKFIPTAIKALLAGNLIPVYGNGQNVREWIHVDDHCDAIEIVLERGSVGQQYNIGSIFSSTNTEIARLIAMYMGDGSGNWNDKIEFVADRPGHDFRYALDCTKIQKELGWQWSTTLDYGLQKTIQWYKDQRLV